MSYDKFFERFIDYRTEKNFEFFYPIEQAWKICRTINVILEPYTMSFMSLVGKYPIISR